MNRQTVLDVVFGTTIILMFEGSSYIDRVYYGIYGLKLYDLQLFSYLATSIFLLATHKICGYSKFFLCLARTWMLGCLACALLAFYGPGWAQVWGLPTVIIFVMLCGALGIWISFIVDTATWSRLRFTALVFSSLIIGAPLLVGPFLDENIVWLEPSPIKPITTSTTLVLLFDEMNARDSFGMQQILLNHGLQVQMTSVKPAHGSTTEVVPAMFSNNNFEGARPCGTTRVCAKGAAFDFAKVAVQRKDVDIVGFHHPYCAINGLRYCRRLTTNRSFFNWNRWKCNLLYRVGFSPSGGPRVCQKDSHAAWLSMREEVIAGVLGAPSLRYGGVLFAHLPLPHPPAIETGSLADQYLRNIRDAEGLLGELLTLLETNKIEPRIMIFSDHPLRQALWCKRESRQFDSPCKIEPILVDEFVPFIVAGRSILPSIENIESNQNVFKVLKNWLKQS